MQCFVGISHWLLCCTVALAAFLPVPAMAQQQAAGRSDVLEEIVVTAQRRAEALQDVPISISVLSGDTIEHLGIVEFRDYATRIPNLAFAYTDSLSGTAQSIGIRGVFGRTATGFYLDETPLPSSIDPRVIDLDRIEVLRGPQGTLYGARSMGGTVRLITQQPSLSGSSASAHVIGSSTKDSGYNGSIDGSANLPLVTDTLAVRAHIFADEQSGVYDRVPSDDAPEAFPRHDDVDSQSRLGGQLAARAEFLDRKLLITPRVLLQEIDTDGRPYADVTASNRTQQRIFDVEEEGRDSWQLYTLTGQYEAPFGEFVSATSDFHRKVRDSEDFSELAVMLLGTPPVPALIRAHADQDTFAQEFRFASRFGGSFQLTAGAFYQKTDSLSEFPPTPIGEFVDDVFSQSLSTTSEEKAIFGELTWEIVQGLKFTAGARWFEHEIDFNGFQAGASVTPVDFQGALNEDGTTSRFTFTYEATPDLTIYATASEGFRTGGVNQFSPSLCADDLAALQLTAEEAQSFDSDSLWNYEIGAKSSWADRRLTVNGALFRIDWDQLQQGIGLNSCGFGITINAGAARSEGGEIEIETAVTDALRLSAGAGYADARIVEKAAIGGFEPGQPIQQVPEWTVNAGVDFSSQVASLPLTLHADYEYVGESISRNNGLRPRPSYSLVNVRATVTVKQLEISAFANNLFDESANLSDIPSLAIELPGRPRIVASRPQTIGLEIRMSF